MLIIKVKFYTGRPWTVHKRRPKGTCKRDRKTFESAFLLQFFFEHSQGCRTGALNRPLPSNRTSYTNLKEYETAAQHPALSGLRAAPAGPGPVFKNFLISVPALNVFGMNELLF